MLLSAPSHKNCFFFLFPQRSNGYLLDQSSDDVMRRYYQGCIPVWRDRGFNRCMKWLTPEWCLKRWRSIICDRCKVPCFMTIKKVTQSNIKKVIFSSESWNVIYHWSQIEIRQIQPGISIRTRSSATAEKQRVSCPQGGGARPSSPFPLRPLWLYLCEWSHPKATTYVRQACRP